MKINDPLLAVSETPALGELYNEFVAAGGLAQSNQQRERAREIRYNRWTGRSSDYKKHRKYIGKDPVPWEDAWDHRAFVADDIIDDLVDVIVLAVEQGELAVSPTEARDIPKAGTVKRVLKKYMERMGQGLKDEVEFMAQNGLMDGKGIWQTTWQRQVAMKLEAISLEQLEAHAAQAEQDLAAGQLDEQSARGAQVIMQLPQLVADPANEDALVDLLVEQAGSMAERLFRESVRDYGGRFLLNYNLSPKLARKTVRNLRERGYGEFPVPYLAYNGPCVVARQVGYDIFPAVSTTKIHNARSIQVLDWMTEADLREATITEGWNADWVETAVKHAGSVSNWGTIKNQLEIELADEDTAEYTPDISQQTGLIEVVYAYVRQVSPEGVPQVWCTVYSPHCTTDEAGEEIFAAHYPLKEADYPFMDFRREKVSRRLYESRGVPELVGADQAAIKNSIDMLVDREGVEINPPWLVSNRVALRYKAGPGAQVPRIRQGELEPMPPPTGNPELAFRLIEFFERRLAYRWGLIRDGVPPAQWQLKTNALIRRFLASVSSMLRGVLVCIQNNVTAAELNRLGAGVADFPQAAQEIAGEYDVGVHFDTKNLDMEFVFQKLQAIANMAVPLDRAGRIDMGALVSLFVTAVDPTYAQALITDQQTADKRVYEEVKREVAYMYLGNEADYVENDPTAKAKMDALEKIVFGDPRMEIPGNMEYQAALGMPPRDMEVGQMDPAQLQALQQKAKPQFMELMQKYQQNLQMSLKQDANKPTGRTGVKPGPSELVRGG